MTIEGYRVSVHVTRNALAALNNEAHVQGNGRLHSLSVQSFVINKNTRHGNFVIGRFQTRDKNGLSV